MGVRYFNRVTAVKYAKQDKPFLYKGYTGYTGDPRMNVRYFNQSRIRPTIRPRVDWRPKAKASSLSSSASAKQVTHYHIEQIDLPSDIGLYGQRQIMQLMQMILAKEPIGVLDPSMREYFNIAHDLVSQLLAKQTEREIHGNNK